MTNSTPAQLRFAPSAGVTLRADFDGGGLSSDLGPLLLRGVDRQIGLTARLAAAIDDRRHPGYVKHALPSSCPFKHLLWQLTERLYLPNPLRVKSS